MKKKLMATLLALALVMSLVPTVFASDPGGSGSGAGGGSDTPTVAKCATCECILANCRECKAATEDVRAAAVCPCKATTESEEGHSCGTSCKFQPCTDADCDSFEKILTGHATHTYTCKGTAATESACKADSHKKGCIKNCDKTVNCTNDVPGNHKTGCKKVEAAVPFSEKVTFELDCDCTMNHDASNNHVAAAGPAAPVDNVACTRKVTVTAEVTFTVVPADLEAGPTDEEISSARTAAVNAKKAELNGQSNYCDACRKAELSTCTMGVGCTAPIHKADCLAKCTRTSSCPNTSGDPTVHLTVYTVTKNGAAFNGGQEYTSLAAAQAAIEEDKEADAAASASPAAEGPAATPAPVVYEIIGHACPKANVADHVVLTGGGNTATDPGESEKPTESQPVEITKAEDFTDVNAEDWFAPELTAVIEKGWLKGNGDGSFNPNGDVSGQEAVVFVSRMLGKDLVTSGADWAAEATKWAADEGLTEGIEITSEGIARKDLILLLWRAAGKQTSDHEISFSDVDELEGDYLTALKWAVENEIIKGNDDGTATPHAATSRGEIAAILARYDKAVNK